MHLYIWSGLVFLFVCFFLALPNMFVFPLATVFFPTHYLRVLKQCSQYWLE